MIFFIPAGAGCGWRAGRIRRVRRSFPGRYGASFLPFWAAGYL